MNLNLLKQLSEAPGVPGREERVRAIIEREAKKLFDDVSTDNLGSLIAVKRSKAKNAKKVLIAAHIDEIGFYVRHIDDKGFVRIQNAGGCDTHNRVAAFVAIEALRKAKNPKYEVVLAATVQEEVGCRGAGPAAFAQEPDIALAIDTTLAVDIPGVPEDERVTKQGDGVALTIMDSLTISDRSLIDELEAAAKKREIPYQLSILPKGGTDAGPMQRARRGVRAATISVPTRYIHTVTECIHKRDLQAAIDLVAAWMEG